MFHDHSEINLEIRNRKNWKIPSSVESEQLISMLMKKGIKEINDLESFHVKI